ncbi:hypothetical protein WN48_10289 [Eufriesea mexicana]|uniref:Uncharacterized protein n=1 Tax=Eufriesea mexicana TaxID=516756 RepID=A0A310SRK2_9HYME|nr:hypothetical protein WN48_10289 [Eufriesea mexicana]
MSENFPHFKPSLAIGRARGVSIVSNADWSKPPSLFYTELVVNSSVLIIAST